MEESFLKVSSLVYIALFMVEGMLRWQIIQSFKEL